METLTCRLASSACSASMNRPGADRTDGSTTSWSSHLLVAVRQGRRRSLAWRRPAPGCGSRRSSGSGDPDHAADLKPGGGVVGDVASDGAGQPLVAPPQVGRIRPSRRRPIRAAAGWSSSRSRCRLETPPHAAHRSPPANNTSVRRTISDSVSSQPNRSVSVTRSEAPRPLATSASGFSPRCERVPTGPVGPRSQVGARRRGRRPADSRTVAAG